jgi:hypothetical protein
LIDHGVKALQVEHRKYLYGGVFKQLQDMNTVFYSMMWHSVVLVGKKDGVLCLFR